MRLRSVTAGVIAGFLLVGCESPEPADNPDFGEYSPKLKIDSQFLEDRL